jgi:hypothetical protein
MEANVLGAPSVVKADVEQVRAERQLQHDSRLIEQIALAAE